MRVVNVPKESTEYKGEGWAVACVKGEELLSFVYIDHPDTSDINAACNAAESKLDAIDAEVETVGGKLSCWEFCFAFSKNERKSLRINNRWF